MARRRHQSAKVRRTGDRFWIRYRVDVMKAEHTLGRKEAKVTLGYAPEMTKRMAERKADEIDLTGDFCTSRKERLEDRKEPGRCRRRRLRQSRS